MVPGLYTSKKLPTYYDNGIWYKQLYFEKSIRYYIDTDVEGFSLKINKLLKKYIKIAIGIYRDKQIDILLWGI